MAKRLGGVVLGLLLGACARPQAAPRPVPQAVPPAPASISLAADSAALQRSRDSLAGASARQASAPKPVSSRTDSTAQNAALAFDRKAATDSLADAKALAALNNTTALATLPPVPIDETPALDLNAAAFADQPRVQYFIDYFTNRGRDPFQIWLNRMPRYEDFIRERMADNKMPGDMVYLALIESGFSTSAVSSASAVGMWQFMAATGKGYGLRVDGWVDERRDPIKSTDAAARHLRELTDKFGSYYLAAAAYNAGAGKVGRGLTRLNGSSAPDSSDEDVDLSSGEDFFSLADAPRLLRQETKDYVPKLIAATLIAKNPARYGFDVATGMAVVSRDSVMVMGGTGLDLIARLADTTLDAMRELNPHLLRLVAPPTMITYPIRVPAGSASSVAERYEAVRTEDRLALVTYKVKAGETVASIAKGQNADADEIRILNRAARTTKLAAGTTLYIPHTTIPMALLRDVGSSTATTTHLVRSGETLGGIARKYGTTVTSLRNLNHLSAKGTIRVGQRLAVAARPGVAVASSTPKPSSGKPAAAPKQATVAPSQIGSGLAVKPSTSSVSASTLTHIVKAGDTVSGIAMKYGIRQSKLLAANNMRTGSRIVIGQKLRIPA